jgi:hypothetical protein
VHTDFSELSEAVAMTPHHSTLFAQRHVAWDWASTLDYVGKSMGNGIVWIADSYDGPECYGEKTLATLEELERACETAESIRAVNGEGKSLTPTVSLV